MTNLDRYILNLYPSEAAAEEHALLLSREGQLLWSRRYIPIKVTWWPLATKPRNHAWALIEMNKQEEAMLLIHLAAAWRCNIVVGKFLPLDGSPDPDYVLRS